MKFAAITEKTDRDWPADHPLREISSIIADDAVMSRSEFLLCSDWGDSRLPTLGKDYDVKDTCSKCGKDVCHLASAPKLPPLCSACWNEIK